MAKPDMHPALQGRPGLKSESPRTNALARDLGDLAKRHGLLGAVLVSFGGSRVGVNSCGRQDLFAVAMERLGDQILAAIDDGKFDPDPQLAASVDLPSGRA